MNSRLFLRRFSYVIHFVGRDLARGQEDEDEKFFVIYLIADMRAVTEK